MGVLSKLKDLFKPGPKKVVLRDRFDMIARVGQGSMSKVFKARDKLTGRTVAVKVLDKGKTKALEQRFVGLQRPSEGEVALALRHPNIVHTFEAGITSDNEQFLAMEFIEGVGLNFLIDTKSPQLEGNRLNLLLQSAEAIQYFHEAGFIHRDICPRNLLINQDGQVKLIDFGLAVPNTPVFQRPGNRTGTVRYMAPELIKRRKTDQRIDIFSFAVSCYETYTRTFPWEAGESLQEIVQHINSPPKDIRDVAPHLNARLCDVIMKGLERNPRDRWQSMREVTAALRELEGKVS